MASETPERRRRLTGRALTLSAAAVGAGAGIALQRRYARSIARDPDYARLTAPLDGDVLLVRSSDGTDLHVESFGADDQAVVLLVHGWTEQLSFWRPVIRLLRGRGLRLVAYDLRGHGRSGSAADGDYSLARYGDDLEAVLAAVVGDGQRAVTAGHSLGAMSIDAWAERHEIECRARAAAMLNTGQVAFYERMLIELERTRYMSPLERSAEVADALHKLAVDTAPVVGMAAAR